MSLESDLAAAVATAQADAAKLRQIVQGPASGDASLVSTENGNVKTLARITAEAEAAATNGVTPFYLPIPWTTGLTAVVGPPATCVTFGGETFVCNTPHFTGAAFAGDAGKWTKIVQKGDTGPGPWRNRLINGDFFVDQRREGASQTFTAGAAIVYTVDRWYAQCSGANITGQRVGGTAPNQFAYRFTGAASNTGLLFGQRIEAANSRDLAGLDVVGSLKAKSSSITTLNWAAYWPTALDNYASKTLIANGNITINPALAQYSFTFNAGGGVPNGLAIEFSAGALTGGNTLEFESVQLEAGTVATSFERPSISERLRACQRYYEKSYDIGLAPGTVDSDGAMFNRAFAANSWEALGVFQVIKRVPPTVVLYSTNTGTPARVYNANGGGDLSTGVGALNVGVRQFRAACSQGNANDFLICHFTADSEL